MKEGTNVKCWICGRKVSWDRATGFYDKYGLKYYCDNECQKQLASASGEPPQEAEP